MNLPQMDPNALIGKKTYFDFNSYCKLQRFHIEQFLYIAFSLSKLIKDVSINMCN